MVLCNYSQISHTYRNGWQIAPSFLRMYEINCWKTKCYDDAKEWDDCFSDTLARQFLCGKDLVWNRINIKLGQLAFELVKNDFSLCFMVQPEGQTSVDHPNPRDWNACQRKCMSPTRNNGWSFVPRKDTIFVAPNNNTKTRSNEFAIKFIIKF